MDKLALYLETIKEEYSGLDILSSRLHTSEGQFNDILFINDDLIFRFPRYEENIKDFLQEIDILQKLQGYLSVPIPDPVYQNSGRRSIGKVFMGYRIIPGKPLFRSVLSGITEDSIFEGFAQQLANFLQCLHNISPATLGLDLHVHDQLAESKALFINIQEHLFPFMRPDARDTVSNHFENYFNDASLHEYDPTLIHGDFGGSNILFEAHKVTGVIDFSFAGLGDPATDIAAVSTFGDLFLARICKYYLLSESTLQRARFYQGTYALQEALHGYRNNDQEAFRSGMEQYI